jgi:hypothetical protein
VAGDRHRQQAGTEGGQRIYVGLDPLYLFIAADFRDKPLEALTLRFQETLSPQDAARRAERHLIREHGKKISLSRPTNSSPTRCKKPLTPCRC